MKITVPCDVVEYVKEARIAVKSNTTLRFYNNCGTHGEKKD